MNLCEKHGKLGAENDYGDVECEDCIQDRAERAFDMWIEDYYGGSAPQTDRERMEIASRERF